MSSDQLGYTVLIAYILIAAFLVARSIRRCQDGWGVWLLYFIERLYVPLMFRWRPNSQPSPLPATGGAIVIANHRSPIDPLLLWMNHHFRADTRGIRVVGFLTAAEYCEIPGLRWLVRTMRSIPVNRNGRDMAPTREAIKRLKDGQLIGIFPEGGLNFGIDLREPNPGVAFLALKAQVPVIPMYIHGAPQSETSMTAPFTTRCRVRVSYGQPIDLSEFQGRKTSQELLVEVTNLLMARLAELGGVGFVPAQIRGESTASES